MINDLLRQERGIGLRYLSITYRVREKFLPKARQELRFFRSEAKECIVKSHILNMIQGCGRSSYTDAINQEDKDEFGGRRVCK